MHRPRHENLPISPLARSSSSFRHPDRRETVSRLLPRDHPARRGVRESLGAPALSATHIAYGSIRMEPVFMILGQSAATAASRAIDDRVAPREFSAERCFALWPTRAKS